VLRLRSGGELASAPVSENRRALTSPAAGGNRLQQAALFLRKMTAGRGPRLIAPMSQTQRLSNQAGI
jgi:hypothetical protein